ncbi:hypothetical protein E3J62_01290 [candidate division TA06 bacterium]|uniref:IrrE N-terminal-like domain-containing protein n=1 Tax=candidate division TA06 bacterium TaxID=2250710 RepID=A0A523UY81_UNCT6|nr:MAG: hypothetical protein E3J62_01290 [candidate division TA06 bacterium]
MRDHYAAEEIWYADAGVVTRDNDLRHLISRVLQKVPKEVVDKLMDQCLILMPRTEEKGVFLSQKELVGKSIIAFPESLLEEPEAEREQTVLHEVAHFWLGHKSPLVARIDYDKQEEAADDLVKQWIREY